MRYFFNVHDGVVIDDREGSEHPDDESAMWEAREVATELLAEGIRRKNDRRHWSIAVNDENGDLIGTVFLSDFARPEHTGRGRDDAGSGPSHT